MTTNIDNWTLFVTPASYTYVTYGSGAQLVNGETSLATVKGSTLGTINADGTWSIKVTANNKNNDKIKKTYTLTIGLMDPKDGNTLTDLDFSATAQTNDRDVYRNIEKNVNTFDAQIDTHTDNSDNVTNLNLEVPVSLTNENDLGLTYRNVVTYFATNDGGVAYVVTSANDDEVYVAELKALDPTNTDAYHPDDATKIATTTLADATNADTNNKDGWTTGTAHGGQEAKGGLLADFGAA